MSTATAPATKTPERTESLMEKAICISVGLRRLGNSRKVSTDQVTVDADKALIKVRKTILDSEELNNITKLDGEIRGYINRRCLPSMFRSGVYLLPIALVAEVDVELERYRTLREQLIEKFIAVYPAKIQNASERLRGIFNAADYPGVDEVRQSFAMDLQYLTFGVPGQLKAVSGALFAREQEKAKVKLAEATEEIKGLLRANMAEMVDHMVDRLSGTRDNGKPKIFKESMLKNLKDFLETFEARNITNDGDLDGLVQKARQLVSGVDAKELKNVQGGVREKVRSGFEEIKATLDTMVVDQPARMISFEDE